MPSACCGWWRRSRGGRPRRGHGRRGCAAGWTRTRSWSRARTARSRSGAGCSSSRSRVRTPTPSCRCRALVAAFSAGVRSRSENQASMSAILAASGTLAGASWASSQASGDPAARSWVRARWVKPVPNRFRNSRSREVADQRTGRGRLHGPEGRGLVAPREDHAVALLGVDPHVVQRVQGEPGHRRAVANPLPTEPRSHGRVALEGLVLAVPDDQPDLVARVRVVDDRGHGHGAVGVLGQLLRLLGEAVDVERGRGARVGHQTDSAPGVRAISLHASLVSRETRGGMWRPDRQ